MTVYEGLDRDGRYLVDMLYAPACTKLCLTAIQIDVFSQLAAPRTAADLAAGMGWHAENTGLFLDTLAAIRLLKKEGALYRNTECANRYLVRDGVRYMGDFMQMYAGLGGFAQADLAALVREGPTAAQEEAVDNVSFAEQMDVMRRGQAGERAYGMVALLSSLPEFSQAKKLLDLGCGAGMLGIAAAQASPGLQVVLFDTPAMEAGIRESIRLSGLDGRAAAMGGDYLGGDIGGGYDIIIALATLNFAKPVLGDVMKKPHTALNPGGVLLASGDGIHADGTQPPEMVVGWLAYTMKGMDFRLPGGMVPEAALAAGFKNVHTTMTHTCSGMTEINVIRK